MGKGICCKEWDLLGRGGARCQFVEYRLQCPALRSEFCKGPAALSRQSEDTGTQT